VKLGNVVVAVGNGKFTYLLEIQCGFRQNLAFGFEQLKEIVQIVSKFEL